MFWYMLYARISGKIEVFGRFSYRMASTNWHEEGEAGWKWQATWDIECVT